MDFVEMDKLKKFIDREYFVKENILVYYTKDMDKTVKWFEDVLGWYGEIMDRDENGVGTYGFTGDIPQEFLKSKAVSFKGIHFWNGEPAEKVIAIIVTQDIQALYNYVTEKGWSQISGIQEEGASEKTCFITTIDGSVLMFIE